MRFLRACACGLLLLLALATAPAARAGDLQVDLLGWRLQQFDHGLAEALGEPWKTFDQGGRSSRVYRVGDKAYVAITVDRRAPHYIDSLQFTGFEPGPTLIHGLHLGDPRDKVLATLGAPDRIKPLDIRPVEPLRVDVWEYDDRNYSVELDPLGRLYSVLLFSSQQLFELPAGSATSAPWQELVAAAASGQFDRLEPLLRPDVEVYRAGESLANRRRYGDFVASPPSDLLEVFFDPTSGVAAAARQAAPQAVMRVTERMGTGLAYRFPPDCLLEEVVFLPYLGRWRVYEVRFRGAFNPALPLERG